MKWGNYPHLWETPILPWIQCRKVTPTLAWPRGQLQVRGEQRGCQGKRRRMALKLTNCCCCCCCCCCFRFHCFFFSVDMMSSLIWCQVSFLIHCYGVPSPCFFSRIQSFFQFLVVETTSMCFRSPRCGRGAARRSGRRRNLGWACGNRNPRQWRAGPVDGKDAGGVSPICSTSMTYVHICIHTYIYIYAYIYICHLFIYLFICLFIHMDTYTHICIYIYDYICIYAYGYLYTYIHIHMDMYIYIYISIYVFTFGHMYTSILHLVRKTGVSFCFWQDNARHRCGRRGAPRGRFENRRSIFLGEAPLSSCWRFIV